MEEGLGYAKRRLIDKIIQDNWAVVPKDKMFSYVELLYVIQEMTLNEGKAYVEAGRYSIHRGYRVFREFVKLLLYRNLANYDSMVLITSEKGCLTDDSLIEMPRDLKKYPRGIPIKDLIDKKDFYVYSFNKDSKRLEVKKAGGCCFVKEDDVYEIELTNGMKLKATKDHPFMLTDGSYKQLKDLVWLEKIKEQGIRCAYYGKYHIKENNKWCWRLTDRLRIMCRPFKGHRDGFLKIDYSDINRASGDTDFKHSQIESRFIAEQIYGSLGQKIVHHSDENHYNNCIENLEIVDSQSVHYDIHGMPKYQFKKNNGYQQLRIGSTFTKGLPKIHSSTKEFSRLCSTNKIAYFKIQKNRIQYSKQAKLREINNINSNQIRVGGIIKSITYVGKQKVYDVYDVQDNHNFIANGFIVSNTGKSSAAIMIAREWCKLIGIRFNPARHIAYTNADVMNKIETLNKFEPIIADEAVRFASSAEWAKKEHKELKKKLAQVRTKHLLYILCFPLKIMKLEKTYLESFTNYWIDLFGRGYGAIYVKDKNPVQDVWRLKAFEKIGSYNEFTPRDKILERLKKHPNYWTSIRFPRPPEWLYNRYLAVREQNVYDDDNVISSLSKDDVYKALLVLSLRDIMQHDTALSVNRIILHIKNEYDIPLSKAMIEEAIEDSRQLIVALREKFNMNLADIKDK